MTPISVGYQLYLIDKENAELEALYAERMQDSWTAALKDLRDTVMKSLNKIDNDYNVWQDIITERLEKLSRQVYELNHLVQVRCPKQREDIRQDSNEETQV